VRFLPISCAHTAETDLWASLFASFQPPEGASLALVRGASACGANERTHQARQASRLYLFSRGCGRDIVVECPCPRLLDVVFRKFANDDALPAAERSTDLQFVAWSNLSMGFSGLAVDVNFAALAGFLRFRSRFEEAGDVEPEIEAHGHADDLT
jgi:hypothetical protein